MAKRKRPRKLNERVLYTPEQTQRYKSAWSRYRKGIEIAREHVVHRVSDEIYRIPSDRSSVGYWEITRTEVPSGLILPVWYRGAGFVTPASVVDSYNPTTKVYSATISYSRNYTLQTDGGDQIKCIAGALYNGTNISISTSYTSTHPFGSVIISNGAYFDKASATVPDGGYSDTTRNSGTGETPGTSGNTSTFFKEGSTFAGIVVDFSVTSRGDPFPATWTDTVNIAVSMELEGSTGEPEYVCTCPDFSRYEEAFVPPPYQSMATPRQWTDSDAGAPEWSDGAIRCKHIVAVQTILEEEIPIPNDPPMGEA